MPDELDQVRESYDRVARAYLRQYAGELSRKPLDRALLQVVVDERAPDSVVADVGCGPGHVTRYLHDAGVPCVGVDVSRGMIDIARQNNPGVDFVEGSLLELPVVDGAWGAIVALYSIIHLAQDSLGPAIQELARALAPGGLLLLAFHVGEGVIHRDEMLGERVMLDFHLIRSRDLIDLCGQARLTVEASMERRPYLVVEAPTTRGYILARKAAG